MGSPNKKLFTSLSINQKREFKNRQEDGAGIFDLGFAEYSAIGILHRGRSAQCPDFELPAWLDAEDAELIKRIMRSGNIIGNIVLSGLEQSLRIPDGRLRAAHKLEDLSGEFLRLLRYPGYDQTVNADHLRFPGHKDAISLGPLFTPMGGLQLPAPNAKRLVHEELGESSWRLVRPVPGTTIVNMDDALELLTTGALTSGLQCVVRAPGAQGPLQRSRQFTAGKHLAHDAAGDPVSPLLSDAQKATPMLTCAEWRPPNGGRQTERSRKPLYHARAEKEASEARGLESSFGLHVPSFSAVRTSTMALMFLLQEAIETGYKGGKAADKRTPPFK
ncbi:hypothetical protein GGS21DRAFT_488924 [Xylaria nigripes]|nr:hypothetical protein GGS21DRAFT_488924 [Xylaria nigripes]